ncbi:E3 ubiquitin-protein ligase RFWD3 isoform X2 [Triticum aestivum]|uniref:E3 ubiquitin-protein ligase RFWD3 isoform X2 n=1 Tax=Triticum aestivum TaxID=4565 RepID=UPI0008433455|nr:E3 ubiquitin-protein ligase RFWD3-like isoform X2 [Triticum aestivum]
MPPQTTSGSAVRVPATKAVEDAAVGEGDHAAVTTPPPPPPTCPICFEPWTCSGGHRICCIPCGHVYGRSCLERWLHHSALASAKCPQCGAQFEDKLITNLYAPENLWEIISLQEFEAHLQPVIKRMEERWMSRIAEHTGKMDLEIDKVRTEVTELAAKMEADRESFRAEAEQMLDSLTAMKEQMRKMVEEENATAKDLLEFVQRVLPRRSSISIPRPSACVSASAPAPVGSENNARTRPDPAGPAHAVKRRRRRGS